MILLALPAWALDGTGSRPTAGEGEVTDPVVASHPARPTRGDGGLRLLAEAAGPTFLLDVDDAGTPSQLAVLDGMFGLSMAAGAGVTDRVALGVALPIWLQTKGVAAGGAALGDLRVLAPVAIVRPGEGGAGLGVSVVPWVDAPTGDATRYLGRDGFGLGALGVAGYGKGRLRASVDLGLAASRDEAAFGVDPSLRLLASGVASVALRPRTGLSLEVNAEKPRTGAATAEARFVARGRLKRSLEVSGGAAMGLAGGLGTADVRLYAGLGWRFGGRTAVETNARVEAAAPLTPYDVGVRVVDEEGRPLDGATVTATRDGATQAFPIGDDGTARLPLDAGAWDVAITAPGRATQTRTLALEDRFFPGRLDATLPPLQPGGARIALVLQDVEGRAVEDARVRVDGADLGLTGPGGTFVLEGVAPGERQVSAEAPGFLAAAPVAVSAAPGAPTRLLVLDRPRGAVKLRVRGPDGPVSDAMARFSGPEDLAPAPVGPTGERDLTLLPGRWQVVVSSAGYGLQARELVIEPDAVGLVVVDVHLSAIGGDAGLGVRVVDPSGRPVADAEVLLDGRLVGRTSNGGALLAEGLDEGPHTLQVRGARFRPLPPRPIELVPGTRDLLVQLDWLPGSVSVVARGPDGPVSDAMIRFAGATVVGPAALGPDGRGFFTLAAGPWTAALSSPTYGMQARELLVDPDATALLEVDATMRAAEAGDAALVVRVRDPDGAGVEGAIVRVDDLVVGTTASAGVLRLEGLQPGKRTVTVSAELCQDTTLSGVGLRAGTTEAVATLAWVPGAVRVRAVGPDGAAVPALARFYGAEALPPLPLGPDGARSFSLAPGKWTVVLSSEVYGLAQREVLVAPGTTRATDLTVTLERPPVETATLLVEVVDPDGAPVPGARLRGGDLDVTLPAGGAVLTGLPVGSRPATVEAEGFQPLAVPRLGLVAGAQERRFVLTPIPRPLQVRVVDDRGAPVDAQVRLVGPARVAPLTARQGTTEARVRPGAWQVLVSAAGFAAERRDVVVAPGTEPVVVDIALSPSRVEVTASAVLLQQQVRFLFNEASLSPESFALLDELAATLLTDAAARRVEIQGHTDAVGTEEYNVALSQRRADVVRDYLVARGVPRDRLVAKGYGTSRPQGPNDTEAGRARNRRVQLVVVE